MRNALILGLAASALSLGACATDQYGYRNNDNDGVRRAATGAAIGAAAGAGVGAVVDGVSPVEGAIAGAVAGGVIGAVTDDKDRNWRRDSRGNCYYVDSDGDRHYDDNRRC